MPRERYRHAIVCLAGYSDFSRRIERRRRAHIRSRQGAGQQPGHALEALAALEATAARHRAHAQPRRPWRPRCPRRSARVPVRVHGEHGRDMDDLDGSSTSRQRVRRLFKPFVHRYITVSRDLASYLEHKVGVPPARITQIYNGVKTERFHPAPAGASRSNGPGSGGDLFVIGTVGRMQQVKDQLTLARAFIAAHAPDAGRRAAAAARDDRRRPAARAGGKAARGRRPRADTPGCRAIATTCRASCAGSISSSCRRWPRASPTPSSRRWRPGCRWSRRRWAAIPSSSRRASPARWSRRTTPSGWPPRCVLYAEDRGPVPAPRRRRRSRRSNARFGMDAMVNAYLAVYDNMLAGAGAAARRQEVRLNDTGHRRRRIHRLHAFRCACSSAATPCTAWTTSTTTTT